MIASLAGKLSEKEANRVVIDVNGVGYEVLIPLSTFYHLGEIGSDVDLVIYTYVREDTLQLFGFRTRAERGLFLRLISVSGIGPKLAVTMLSGMEAEEIISAVRTENLALLTSIPGVGKKTAERIVIELRDKLEDLAAAEGAGEGSEPVSPGASQVFDDALSALMNLGYPKNAAEKAIRKSIKDGSDMSVQDLLRNSLQHLARK